MHMQITLTFIIIKKKKNLEKRKQRKEEGMIDLRKKRAKIGNKLECHDQRKEW